MALEITDEVATTVIAVAGGYPEAYEKGNEITGIEKVTEAKVFHAGTKSDNGAVLSNGGRVLAFTAMADTNENALKKAYQSLDQVSFKDMYYRKDIGFDL